MRLWTVHPKYLDAKGIVALWREGLLAKAVLEGKTQGYRQHPQLQRFRAHINPTQAICQYLRAVLQDSQLRGYHFDAAKLPRVGALPQPIEETRGQLDYEWQHLLAKLALRDADRWRKLQSVNQPEAHPLFTLVSGDVRSWERIT